MYLDNSGFCYKQSDTDSSTKLVESVDSVLKSEIPSLTEVTIME